MNRLSPLLRLSAAVYRDLPRHRRSASRGGPSGARASIVGRFARGCRSWADLLSSKRFADAASIGEQLGSLTLASRERSLKDILHSVPLSQKP